MRKPRDSEIEGVDCVTGLCLHASHYFGCTQDSFRDLYRQGELDSRKVVVDIPSTRISMNTMEGPGGQALQVCRTSLDVVAAISAMQRISLRMAPLVRDQKQFVSAHSACFAVAQGEQRPRHITVVI